MICEQEFFYVACSRTDGMSPGLEKAFHDKIFLMQEDAEKFAEEKGKELNMVGRIKAFRALAKWPDDEKEFTYLF